MSRLGQLPEHWRKPAQGTPASSTTTNPEHGDDEPYGSATALRPGSMPWFVQSTRFVDVAWCQPAATPSKELQPWKTWYTPSKYSAPAMSCQFGTCVHAGEFVTLGARNGGPGYGAELHCDCETQREPQETTRHEGTTATLAAGWLTHRACSRGSASPMCPGNTQMDTGAVVLVAADRAGTFSQHSIRYTICTANACRDVRG